MKKFVILFIAAFLVTTDAFAANAARQQADSMLAETMERVVTGGGGGTGAVINTNTTIGSTTATTENDNSINLCDKMTCPSGMFCSAGCCSFSKN